MRKICVAILACVCFTSASCSSKKSNETNYIFNHDLLTSFENYDKSWNAERSELAFNGGGTAKNCSTYFKLAYQYNLDESIYNQTIKNEYLICDALKILTGTHAVSATNAHDLDLGEKLASKLDLRSFPSSLFQMSDEKTHTLTSLFPKDIKYKGSGVKLETEDFAFQLEVVGVAKINGNAIPDWIIWVADEANSGHFRSYSSLIIYVPRYHIN